MVLFFNDMFKMLLTSVFKIFSLSSDFSYIKPNIHYIAKSIGSPPSNEQV